MSQFRMMYQFMIIGFVFGFITFISFHEFSLDLKKLTGYYAFQPSNLEECYYKDIDTLVCFNLTENDLLTLSKLSNVTIFKEDDYFIVYFNLPKQRVLE